MSTIPWPTAAATSSGMLFQTDCSCMAGLWFSRLESWWCSWSWDFYSWSWSGSWCPESQCRFLKKQGQEAILKTKNTTKTQVLIASVRYGEHIFSEGRDVRADEYSVEISGCRQYEREEVRAAVVDERRRRHGQTSVRRSSSWRQDDSMAPLGLWWWWWWWWWWAFTFIVTTLSQTTRPSSVAVSLKSCLFSIQTFDQSRPLFCSNASFKFLWNSRHDKFVIFI